MVPRDYLTDDSLYIARITVGVSAQTYHTSDREKAFEWLEEQAAIGKAHGLEVKSYGLERIPMSQVPQGDIPWGDDVTRDWHG